MTRMRPSILGSLAIALLVTHQPVVAQRRPASRPQLEGVWNGATLTPLERPAGFEHRATFTPEEAAEYKRTAPDRRRSRLPTAADRLTQADIDDDLRGNGSVHAGPSAHVADRRSSDMAGCPICFRKPARVSRRVRNDCSRIRRRSVSRNDACSEISAWAVRWHRRPWFRPRSSPATTKSCRRTRT